MSALEHSKAFWSTLEHSGLLLLDNFLGLLRGIFGYFAFTRREIWSTRPFLARIFFARKLATLVALHVSNVEQCKTSFGNSSNKVKYLDRWPFFPYH